MDGALYKIGKTKVFLKDAAMEILAERRRAAEKENAEFLKKLLDFQILMKVLMVRKRKRRERNEQMAARALRALAPFAERTRP